MRLVKLRENGVLLWSTRIPRCVLRLFFFFSTTVAHASNFIVQTGDRRVLFDVAKDGQNIAPKWVAAEEEQEENESRR